MKKSTLYALWGGMFSLCAGLGFIPEASGVLAGSMTVLSVLSFVPPVLLLYPGDEASRVVVRNLSAVSLGLTLGLLVLNFLCATQSEVLGKVLYAMLVIVSSPMVCSGHWAMSLFLWACLLMASLRKK